MSRVDCVCVMSWLWEELTARFWLNDCTPLNVWCTSKPAKTLPHHNRFTTLFPGPPGWAGARRELLDFMVQGKINRGKHTDHPAGRHSIRTNQCPPPPSPIFYRPDALPATQTTVSKHWRQSRPKLRGLHPKSDTNQNDHKSDQKGHSESPKQPHTKMAKTKTATKWTNCISFLLIVADFDI